MKGMIKWLYRKMPNKVKIVLLSVYDAIYLKWQFFVKHRPYISNVRNELKIAGITDVKPYMKKIWKVLPVFTQYYVGKCDGEKVFCKVCINDSMEVAKREAKVLERIEKESLSLKEHVPSVIKLVSKKQYDIVVTEFIDGKSLFDLTLNIEDICSQMYEILCELETLKIVHVDIRPSNFIVRDGVLCLIDFGLAYDKTMVQEDCIYSKNTMPDIFSGVGCKKYNPEEYEYDDAYAMLRVLKDICPSLIRDYDEYWYKFNLKIGDNCICMRE